MWPDYVNGAFELFGAFANIANIRALVRDKEIKGVSWISTTFFTTWGFWNLWFYPSLAQWASFTGGLAIVVSNATWLGLLLYYKGAKPCSA